MEFELAKLRREEIQSTVQSYRRSKADYRKQVFNGKLRTFSTPILMETHKEVCCCC
ncbi:hypothetical protein [Halobacillus mangrovi]|uniref:hypothetical protein n=1 Tax=Halobacillus mangrovi TaxID=402384 RepID=UPI0012F4B054|nr:hypothetical protein [Halobacillus mangrovi]